MLKKDFSFNYLFNKMQSQAESPPQKEEKIQKKRKKTSAMSQLALKKKKKSSIIQLSSVHTVDLGVLHLFKQTFHLCRFSTLNLL